MSSRGWLAVASLAACTSGAPVEPTHVAVDPVPAEPAPVERDGAYSVHEWGLLDAAVAGGPVEVAAGPGHAVDPMRPVKKPVLYVHLAEGVEKAEFSVRVEMAHGRVLEYWPLGQLEGEGALFWKNVEARRGHCDTVASGPCTTADHVCEVDDLPGYDVPGAACLHSGETSAGLLFYRGATDGAHSPFHVEVLADGKVRVSLVGDASGAVGEMWRVSAGVGGHRITRASVPGADRPVVLPRGADALNAGREQAALVTAMREMGLTDEEAQAFLGAWSGPLFGVPDAGGKRGPAKDAPMKETKAAQVMTAEPIEDALLFWLPPGSLDEIAKLTFTPPPSEVRRAMLVRVDLASR